VTVVGPRIRTERLLLRPFRPSDLSYLADVLDRPDVVRYLYWEVQTREEAAAMLERRTRLTSLAKPGDRIILAAERVDTGEVVGDVILGWDGNGHRQGEIGFVFHPDHHGRGYASEAARAMLRLGFERAGLHRIYGRCDARNTASARLMERLGMRLEAHFVENEWFKGEWGSELVYAMLGHEWEDRDR
jgi:RimJ/RimL family protein N-acetyltransferase